MSSYTVDVHPRIKSIPCKHKETTTALTQDTALLLGSPYLISATHCFPSFSLSVAFGILPVKPPSQITENRQGRGLTMGGYQATSSVFTFYGPEWTIASYSFYCLSLGSISMGLVQLWGTHIGYQAGTLRHVPLYFRVSIW